MIAPPSFARCECFGGMRCGVMLAPMSDYRLRGGATHFVLFRCWDSGLLRAMPDENFARALEFGTPHTLRRLQELTRLH